MFQQSIQTALGGSGGGGGKALCHQALVIARDSALSIPNIPMELLTPGSLKLLTFPDEPEKLMDARNIADHVFFILQHVFISGSVRVFP